MFHVQFAAIRLDFFYFTIIRLLISLENVFSNVDTRDEYLCHVSFKSLHYRVTRYTVFQKKTSTHIIGYKLKNSCLILIIFDTKIPHII